MVLDEMWARLVELLLLLVLGKRCLLDLLDLDLVVDGFVGADLGGGGWNWGVYV